MGVNFTAVETVRIVLGVVHFYAASSLVWATHAVSRVVCGPACSNGLPGHLENARRPFRTSFSIHRVHSFVDL